MRLAILVFAVVFSYLSNSYAESMPKPMPFGPYIARDSYQNKMAFRSSLVDPGPFGSPQTIHAGYCGRTGDPFVATYVFGPSHLTGSSDFTIQNDGCSGRAISGTQCCPIEILFKPSSPQAQSTTLVTAWTITRALPSGSITAAGSSTQSFTAQANPYLDEPDTKNSCSVQANSTVSIDSLSLKEQIPVVGAPFVLSYSSDMFRPNILVDQRQVGLGGWTVSINHRLDPVNNILYLGTGEHRNVAPRSSGTEVFVASSDGSEVYYFDQLGRHTKTRGGLIGETKFVFGYDSAYLLSIITDQFGNVTNLTHVAGGGRITSAYGQVTTLKSDENGFLSEVTNPNNETHRMVYTERGYLTNFTKPAGQTSSVTYDELGFVVRDSGAGGDILDFLRENLGQTSQNVEVTTALNRKTKYTTSISDRANSSRTVEQPDVGAV